jgi:hypothetical protein
VVVKPATWDICDTVESRYAFLGEKSSQEIANHASDSVRREDLKREKDKKKSW